MQTLSQWLLSVGAIYLTFLSTGVLPFLLIGFFIGYTTHLAAKRIIELGGFRMMYITGWLGVPVHELSHVLAAWIGGHKVVRFAPFSPNPKTGQLGVVETKYDQKNRYQRIVGNFLIPIAPLVGGTTVLLLLTRWIIPGYSTTAYGGFRPPTSATLNDAIRWQSYLENVWLQLLQQISWLWHPELVTRWQTYPILYAMLCVAVHISPSIDDWKNFRKPLLWFIALLAIVSFFIGAIPAISEPAMNWWAIGLTWLWPMWLFLLLIVSLAVAPILIFGSVFAPSESPQVRTAKPKKNPRKQTKGTE
ncbi:MAG: hypothetical protein OEM52_06185 [bacterium]|nr:hypothetical protein [bacterium]